MSRLKNCISVINTKSNSFNVYMVSRSINSINLEYRFESYLSIEDKVGNSFYFNFYELKMFIGETIKRLESIEKNRNEIISTFNVDKYKFIRNLNNEFQGSNIIVDFSMTKNGNTPILLFSLILNNKNGSSIRLFENENFVKLKVFIDEFKVIMNNFHVLHSNNIMLYKIGSVNDIRVEEDHKVNIDTNISENVTHDYKADKRSKDVDTGLKLDTNSNIPKSYDDTVKESKIPQAVESTPIVAPTNQFMLDALNGLDGFENDSLDANTVPNEVPSDNNNVIDDGQGYSPF